MYVPNELFVSTGSWLHSANWCFACGATRPWSQTYCWVWPRWTSVTRSSLTTWKVSVWYKDTLKTHTAVLRMLFTSCFTTCYEYFLCFFQNNMCKRCQCALCMCICSPELVDLIDRDTLGVLLEMCDQANIPPEWLEASFNPKSLPAHAAPTLLHFKPN